MNGTKTAAFPKIWLIVLWGVASLILLVDGFYLLIRHTQLQKGVAEVGGGVCSIAGGGCDEVLLSAYSSILGISAGAWGCAYGVFGLLLIFALLGNWGPRRALGSCYVLATGFGLAGSLAFLKVLYIDLGLNCPLCLLYHMGNLVMTLTGWGIASTWVPLTKNASSDVDESEMSTSRIVPGLGLPLLGALAILLGYLSWQSNIRLNSLQEQLETMFTPEERALLLWNQGKVFSIVNDPDSPALGPEDAEHTLIAFKDFECPPCGRLSTRLAELHRRFPTQVRIVYKHYPLGSDCNPVLEGLGSNMHVQACEAAEAAEAARVQGKFWEFHDLAFAKQRELPTKPFQLWAEEVGLDMERFNRDLLSSEGRKRIAKDVVLGDELDITSTPTVFFDGREVDFWSKEKLWNKFMAVQLGGERINSATEPASEGGATKIRIPRKAKK